MTALGNLGAARAPVDALALARGYVVRGWRPFPIPHGSKRFDGTEVRSGWATMTASEPTDAMLRLWFPDGRPMNIGLGMRGSMLVVIDEDTLGEFDRLCVDLGRAMPQTYTVRTAKGRQFYFQDPSGALPNRTDVGGYDIDVRGPGGDNHGGYVVAAGSLHPSGVQYRVEDPDSEVCINVPDWLAEWVRTAPGRADVEREATGEAPRVPQDGPRRFTTDEAVSYVDREARAPLVAAEYGSNVNDRLNRAGLVLGHFVPEFWDEDAAREALGRWLLQGPGARNGWTELDEDDRRTIESGLRRGMAEPYGRREPPGLSALTMPAGAALAVEVAASPFVDLGPYLRGEVVAATPTLGLARARDGLRLLYPGLVHLIMGETEGGKSWLALAHAAAEIAAGRTVVYIHAEESSPAGSIERLRLLGLGDEQISRGLLFVALEGPLGSSTVEAIADRGASLVVIDGYNEALTAHGFEIMKPDGPAGFRGQVVSPLARSGAAVAILDHVVKDPAANGNGYPLGSVHKINAIDGAAFLLETEEAFGRGRRGAARLYVVKDRPGHLRGHGEPTKVARKFRLGVMAVDARPDERFSLEVWPPVPEEEREQNEAFDDEKILALATELIRASPEGWVASADVCAMAAMRKQRVTDALTRLVVGQGALWRGTEGRRTVYRLPSVPDEHGPK